MQIKLEVGSRLEFSCSWRDLDPDGLMKEALPFFGLYESSQDGMTEEESNISMNFSSTSETFLYPVGLNPQAFWQWLRFVFLRLTAVLAVALACSCCLGADHTAELP